jgi:hypothetical protein
LLINFCFRPEKCVQIPLTVPEDFPEIPPKFTGLVFGNIIYDSDLSSCMEGNDLTDNAIDTFMVIMKGKAEDEGAAVFILPCYLLATISMGLPFDDWIKPENMFHDLWLIPTQIERNHWVLLVAFMRRKIFLVLDPLYKNMGSDIKDRIRVSLDHNIHGKCEHIHGFY